MDTAIKRFNAPPLNYLGPEELGEIHSAALHLLQTLGAAVHHDEALALLQNAGAQIEAGQRVHLPAGLVEWALK